MNFFYKWLSEGSLKNRNLYYKLNIIFGLFFLLPIFGFIYFAYKHNLLRDEFVPIFFIGVLAFSFAGFAILKNLFDKLTELSKNVSNGFIEEMPNIKFETDSDEVENIIHSFTTIKDEFSSTFKQLEKKTSEVSILKELSDLCYVTFDNEEMLYITLERAMTLTDSDIGSVLTIEKTDKKQFVVKACIGLGEYVKRGDHVDFETSIAKYAVLNKSPLIVKDVEKDRRFGRENLSHCGTKSFICMPIKTSKAIIGVLTLSCKDGERIYTEDDVEALAPLLSNAAFTYENLSLLKENQRVAQQLKAIEKIFTIINSSFRIGEIMQGVFNEIKQIIPFNIAIILTKDGDKKNQFSVFDLKSKNTENITKGKTYFFSNPVFSKALKQESTIIINTNDSLLPKENGGNKNTESNDVEKELFMNRNGTACMLTPLKNEGTINGILAITVSRPEMFRYAQEFVEWIANGLSIVIERNRLSTSIKKRNQELETIKQIGGALASSTFDMSKVLKYTMDMIRMLMNVEAGSLLLLEKDELEFAVAFNIKVKTMKKFRLKIGQGIVGHVASIGKPVIVNDVRISPYFFPGVDSQTGFVTRSTLCVPMISQGSVIGVIQVLNKIDGEFSENDKDLLQSIASSVSIAIENARLYKETVAMAEHERGVRRMFQKFVPKEVLDNIIKNEKNGKAFVDEIKTVSLLNLDIRNFTTLAFEMGPRKTVALLNSFFKVMGGIVFKNNGIVDKYLGDGFLALFGAPVSSIRDADNAVATALEMKHAMSSINERFKKEMGTSINIGISIHTGEVVVGNIGFEKKMDYTVIGDAVNTVFKLQELTKPYKNGIIVGESTCRMTQSHLKVQDIEENVKNMKSFELLGVFSKMMQI